MAPVVRKREEAGQSLLEFAMAAAFVAILAGAILPPLVEWGGEIMGVGYRAASLGLIAICALGAALAFLRMVFRSEKGGA